MEKVYAHHRKKVTIDRYSWTLLECWQNQSDKQNRDITINHIWSGNMGIVNSEIDRKLFSDFRRSEIRTPQY